MNHYNPSLMIFPVLQLRYLQALTNVSIENNKTVVFPVPVQIINKLAQMAAARRAERASV